MKKTMLILVGIALASMAISGLGLPTTYADDIINIDATKYGFQYPTGGSDPCAGARRGYRPL